MKLLAVIVNYQSASMTLDALRALMKEGDGQGGRHVIVVDNGSGDGSFEKIDSAVRESGWSEQVSLVESGRNGGLGFGINYAVRPALASSDPPDYVYLLNSDALVEPGALTHS